MIRRFLAPDKLVANVCAMFIGLLGLVVTAGRILRLPALWPTTWQEAAARTDLRW